jgi:hypothetical protein
MAEKKRRGGGGKLARTETVQVRLDPKLRFAADLAAAKERRTLSSFIEWAVERAVQNVSVTINKEGNPVSAATVIDKVWDADTSDRFVNLAWHYPELLTHDEQRKWKFIFVTAEFWQSTPLLELDENLRSQGVILKAMRDDLPVRDYLFHLNRPLLRAAWGIIEKHISGEEEFNRDTLCSLLEQNPPTGIPVMYEQDEPTISTLKELGKAGPQVATESGKTKHARKVKGTNHGA